VNDCIEWRSRGGTTSPSVSTRYLHVYVGVTDTAVLAFCCYHQPPHILAISHLHVRGTAGPAESRIPSLPSGPSRVIARYPTSRLAIPPTTTRQHSCRLRRAARPNPPSPGDARAPLIQPRTCISRFEPCEVTQSGLGSALRHPVAWRLAPESLDQPGARCGLQGCFIGLLMTGRSTTAGGVGVYIHTFPRLRHSHAILISTLARSL